MKWKIVSDDFCLDCKLKSETSFHALWFGRAIKLIWELKFTWLLKISRNCNSFLDVIQLCQEHSYLFELFAMIVSLIGACKNQLRVGEKMVQLEKINAMAVDNL